MSLSDVDLARIRDEVGVDDPTDDQLYASYDQLGHWLLVSLRVLKRRRAKLAAGGVSSVAIPGAVSVSLRSDLAALDRQIAALTLQYEQETSEDLPGGASSTRLRRRVPR